MKRLVPIVVALSLTILLASIVMAQEQLDFHLSDSPDGPAMTQFPSGTTGIVYAIFNCIDEIEGEEIVVRVKGDYGTILFEQTETCTGPGTKSMVTAPGGEVFPDGRYLTNLYRQSEFPAASVIWEVGVPVMRPVATPTTASPVAKIYGQVKDFAVPAAAILLIILVVWAIYRVFIAR